jgi:murein tripeptide amidase MpaA
MTAPAVQFDQFYTYDEIDAYVRSLAEAFPNLCQLGSIGRSRDGREIHLLTLTNFDSANPKDRPAYVIHGGIHAHEPASAHGPLYTAQKLLADHEPDGLLSRIAFYIVPRLCADGSEVCIATSARIRSRTDFVNRESNAVYPEDLDGDGLILTIRQEHPDGRFVADPADPRLLIRRRADSPGPFYRFFPEGRIHDWDGGDRITMAGLHSFFPQTPDLMGGRSFDWNRNWSYNWRPESEQMGSGDYPFSELEMRHFVEFLYGHPKIFGILGYHCGRSSIIRPPASGSREDLDAGDDTAMEELGQKGAELTRSPLVSLVDSHNGRRNKGKGGHSLDFAYHHLGIFGFEVELGTVLNAAGLRTEACLEWTEEQVDEWMRRLLKWWDDRGQRDTLFEPWRPFEHPQLGAVELGGFHYTVLDNPLVSELRETVEGAYRFTVEHARQHPRIVVEELRVDQLDANVYRVRLRVANRGQLPTHVTNKGRQLRRMEPVVASFAPAAGVELLSAVGHLELGHVEGVTGSRVAEWFVALRGGATDQPPALGDLQVTGGTGGDIFRNVKLPGA